MVNVNIKQEDLDDLRKAIVPFVKISEKYGKKFLQYYGDFVSNLKERHNDFQNPLLKKMGEAAEKGYFMPKRLIRDLTVGMKSADNVLFDEEFLTTLISKNTPAYKKRIERGLPLSAHIEEDGKEYDSTNTLSDEDFENLEPVKGEKYLRPTWMCEVDAPEIRAKAKSIRSKVDSDWEFAEEAFYFVKNEKDFLFEPLNGALSTLKSRGGMCLDKSSLLIALCRVEGIPSRYNLHSVRLTDRLRGLVSSESLTTKVFEALEAWDSLHGAAELKIDGEWIFADPTFTDGVEVNMDVPLTKFGGKATWKDRVGEEEMIREGLPFLSGRIMLPVSVLLRGPIDNVNSELKKMKRSGEKRLEEIGRTRYNREKKESYRDKLPSMEEVKEFRKG